MKAFCHHLSMQEVFEEVARQIVEEQSYMVNLLENLAEKKRTKAIEGFSNTDAESIFRAIEGENPLKDQEGQ
jgi:F0F1-type ATP synthase delta subunit